MARRGLVLAAVALGVVLGARPAGACDSCTLPGSTLARPTASCQQVSGRTDSACPSDYYAIDLFAGDSVTFTLCNWSCTSATANFDARLRVYDPACVLVGEVDDYCGQLPETWLSPAVSGRYTVEVTGSTASDRGDYTLAWYGFCSDDGCWSPSGDLGSITTSCQTRPDTVTCTQRTLTATLTQGQTYTFTLCPATCPGAGATFDAQLDLYDPAGFLVASSAAACGDDGEIVYTTDPMTGGGTYCIRVLAESGMGDFDLGYRVTCQAPAALTLSPLQARATLPGCAELETFTLTSSGTPVFATSWTISPPAGGTATPASGSLPMPGNSGQFQSTLAGRGIYRVDVTVQNECGRTQQQFQYELRDRTAPDLTLTALAGCGNPPPSPGPAPLPPGLPPEPSARAATVEQLEVSAAKLDAMRAEASEPLTARVPGVVRLPEANAVECAVPCVLGTLEADHPMYDVFLSCYDGSFTARTGAAHPVTLGSSGLAQNVIYGGTAGAPGTSDVAWYFHELGLMVQDPTGGQACLFDPPDTAAEPNSVGIEMEWTATPADGLTVTLREEIVAFGTDETDSGVRLTLGASNASSSTRSTTMGVRWQIDYQNAYDDGPLFATVSCAPPEIVATLDVEHELPPVEVQDFYRIQNNTGDPIFSNFTNTTEIAGFPDTARPDRLTFGYWPNMRGSAWDRPANEGDPGPDVDSAVHYWFGAAAGDGIVLAPGSEFTRSVVIFTSGESVDCSGFTPGNARNAQLELCEGECAELGATATDTCSTPAVALASTSPGAPPCAGNPCEVTFDAAGTYLYTWTATDADGNATEATTTVTVRPPGDCFTGPCVVSGVAPAPAETICEGDRTTLDASGLTLTNCSGAARYEWREGARVIGGNATVTVQPSVTTTYVVTLFCDADPSCNATAAVTVTVVRHPLPGAVTVRDLAPCSLGLEVTWEPATFFNGGGVYNLYRSETSCADALARAPLATGLTGLSYLDATTTLGPRYVYVIEAEDDPAGSGCAPTGGHQSGPAATACSAPTLDSWDGTLVPEPAWAALRVGHAGQRVTLDWTRVRALLPDEHFHVLKAASDATARFDHVNGEGFLARQWSETDTSAPLQFFDLRIANACEMLSSKEYPIYPPGYDLPR